MIPTKIHQAAIWEGGRERGGRRGKGEGSPCPTSSSLSAFRAKLLESFFSSLSLLNPVLKGCPPVKVINDVHITRSNGQISVLVLQILSVNMIIAASFLKDFLTSWHHPLLDSLLSLRRESLSFLISPTSYHWNAGGWLKASFLYTLTS